MQDIVIIGAGGIGREAAWIIEEINAEEKRWNLLGFIDDNSEMWGNNLNGYKVLGGINTLFELENKPKVIVAMANCEMKKTIVEKLQPSFGFATLIYPTVKVSSSINIGQGSIIYPGVVLTVNTIIGDHVLISGNCGIGHDTEIGDYSSVLWGSNFSGYDTLGQGCFIGVGTSIAQGISIEEGYKAMTGSNIVESVVGMEV